MNAFQQEQLQTLVMLFLRLSNYGQAFYEIFWGLYLFAFGLLLIQSRFIPRVFGILMMVGGIGFPINTFTKLLVPEFFPGMITQLTTLFSGIGVVPTLFWILVVGVKEQPPNNDLQAAN